ncbi:hypothetical protein L6R53_15195 [Myxococcota bacterium]|nr:hypothetical protein [Myxococcota bacterium]
MYSWDTDTSDWRGSKKYDYAAPAAARMKDDVDRAKAAGPRSYDAKHGPNEKVIDPRKEVHTASTNPIIVAVDVTGSMARWPFEIFDRLPLLYTTLQAYREDAEILFAAIGDAGVDRWPLQVTTFASGFDLEQQLGAIFGEGGGGDAPESYGLFAHWVDTHVKAPNAEKPFLIVFGDITMHERFPAAQVRDVMGDGAQGDLDAIAAWQRVSKKWNTWFLRRPGGKEGDAVDQQWARAIGADHVFHIDDEQRAVDYAMGLIAQAWGHFGDFQENMLARQSNEKAKAVSTRLSTLGPRKVACPACGGPVPPEAHGKVACRFCGTTIAL